MEQLEFFNVPSPCVGVCTVDDKGYCKGCMRNRDERFNWLTFTSAQKLYIIRLCRQRYQRKRLAGKANKPSQQDDTGFSPQQELF